MTMCPESAATRVAAKRKRERRVPFMIDVGIGGVVTEMFKASKRS